MEATLDRSLTWESIDWTLVNEHVNKLQFRIAKAVKEQKRHKVRRLQYLLKNSFHAKLLAVRRITTNKGRNTPGIDGIILKTPKQKLNTALTLSDKRYKALPLRRHFIEKKGKKKKRPLGIPTMYDRAMQALFALVLEPEAETMADRQSFGFRKYRSSQDAAEYAFNCLALKDRAPWILEGDIKGCFDNISHQWMLANIPLKTKILKEFLSAGFSYKGKLFSTDAGTPQGGIISPILANMTLDGLEQTIKEKYWSSSTGRISRNYNKLKVNFIRYADDFIVTAKSKEVASEIKEIIEEFLKERGLTLSQEKTRITHINEGFDFLGWNFRKYNGKLLIKPSKDSCGDIASKVRDLIKRRRGIAQKDLINILNPVIRGWCNYHRGMVSKEAFKKLDTVLFQALWRWARFRHSGKNHRWIKNRYWIREGNRDWIFACKEAKLLIAGHTKIRRQRMIQLDKNPFLREDSDYFHYRKRYFFCS
jgi:RNA-directed DNA polymerase